MASGTNAIRSRKYDPDTLIAMFRKAAQFRNEMLHAGFTDNGGAIHSAERILNILGLSLKYPGLSHINHLRHFSTAEFSMEAWKLHRNGNKVLIEHVAPIRALTREAIIRVDKGISDAQFKRFISKHYRLVLLSPTETEKLNRLNRSEMHRDRLGSAGIRLKRKKTVCGRGRNR